MQSAEDAQNLQVALYADEVHITGKGGQVLRHRDAGGQGAGMVLAHPVGHARFGPAEEGIAHQAGDVIGHRADHQVLEIQHRRAIGHRHQIAQHEIAVHRYLGLGQGVVHQPAQAQLQCLDIAAVQLQAEVALDEPLLEQARIAQQQGLIKTRQVGRYRHLLQGDQLAEGRLHAGVGSLVGEALRQRRPAQVFEQQEALGQVAGQHLRHTYASSSQPVADGQPTAHILQPGRCVHHDAAGLQAGGAPVAAVAGIGGGTLQPDERVAEDLAQPVQTLRGADVVVIVHAIPGQRPAADATG